MTTRLETTQIRLFLWQSGRRVVHVNGGQLKGYILWGHLNECQKTTLNSAEIYPENRQGDSLNKSQVTLSQGFWWRGIRCRWRWWWWVRTNQAGHSHVTAILGTDEPMFSLRRPSCPPNERGGAVLTTHLSCDLGGGGIRMVNVDT
jgi:hypothetical protein